MRVPSALLLALATLHLPRAALLHAAVCHMDGESGDDARDGSSPAKAWRTLDRVNAQIFQAGDRVLFRVQ